MRRLRPAPEFVCCSLRKREPAPKHPALLRYCCRHVTGLVRSSREYLQRRPHHPHPCTAQPWANMNRAQMMKARRCRLLLGRFTCQIILRAIKAALKTTGSFKRCFMRLPTVRRLCCVRECPTTLKLSRSVLLMMLCYTTSGSHVQTRECACDADANDVRCFESVSAGKSKPMSSGCEMRQKCGTTPNAGATSPFRHWTSLGTANPKTAGKIARSGRDASAASV